MPGFHRDTYADVVGGASAFDRACDGLRSWIAHRGSGLRVLPESAGIAAGETVLVLTSVGPLEVVVPCRVATAIDGPGRFGVSYVTLPGHPECGEESFVLSIQGDDLRFTISALSHPAEALARLGGPVSRVVQKQTNQRYLRAMKDWVAAG